MVEEGCDMFDLSHVEHAEYVVNGKVVVGRATSVDEAQGLVYVGLKGSLGAQGQKIYPRFLTSPPYNETDTFLCNNLLLSVSVSLGFVFFSILQPVLPFDYLLIGTGSSDIL